MNTSTKTDYESVFMNRLTDSKSLEPVERPADQPVQDVDLVLWADRQAKLLRHGRLDELDRERLIEKFEAMGDELLDL